MEYSILLDEYLFLYEPVEPWLYAGSVPTITPWFLFISLRNDLTEHYLRLLLPFFQKGTVPFRIIQNGNCQFRLNGGGYGHEQIGKVITLYPESIETLHRWATHIESLTRTARGPAMLESVRLGTVLYGQSADKKENKHLRPFRKYAKKQQAGRLLAHRFLCQSVLFQAPKGIVFKAINICRLSLTWCVVKKGNPHMAEDAFGRDTEDRLQWEKIVLDRLSATFPAPKTIAYFSKGCAGYLVMSYLDGIPLWAKRKTLVGESTWNQLNGTEQRLLLDFFQAIIQVIAQLHAEGIVHRDITDGNVLVNEKGGIFLIDFEIAYDMFRQEPLVPFILGTHGYVAPEQRAESMPSVAEDIYSLGSLLFFWLSGYHPEETEMRMSTLDVSPSLYQLIAACRSENVRCRPDLTQMKDILCEESPHSLLPIEHPQLQNYE